MIFLERLIDWWRFRGRKGPRRVILLDLVGLESLALDQYLAAGLLHNLALLSDIGARLDLRISHQAICEAVEAAARERRLRVHELNSSSDIVADLPGICRDDEMRQSQLLDLLNKTWSGVLVAQFDMPCRLKQLFGPQPSVDERIVLRDVYARIDEIVGKSYSFVDDSTSLVVLVTPSIAGKATSDQASRSLVFLSRRLNPASNSPGGFAAALFGGTATGQATGQQSLPS